MSSNSGRAQRPDRFHHFSVNGVEHSAFIRQLGKQFHGRIEGYPQAPLATGHSASAVCAALQQWLAAQELPE